MIPKSFGRVCHRGARLLAYNFIQRDRLLQTKLDKKEMTVTFSQFAGKTCLQEVTDDLMFSLLLVVLTDYALSVP